MIRGVTGDRLMQGDVISGVDLPEYSEVKERAVVLSVIRFPFVVVLTQDCDLEQHQKPQRSAGDGTQLVATLVAPAYHYSDLVAGQHLVNLGLRPSAINVKKSSQSSNDFHRNNQPRYHQLPLSQGRAGLPDLVVDFKHYFSVNTNYLAARRASGLVASLGDLYREDLSQRFAAFLARVGLPTQINAMPRLDAP